MFAIWFQWLHIDIRGCWNSLELSDEVLDLKQCWKLYVMFFLNGEKISESSDSETSENLFNLTCFTKSMSPDNDNWLDSRIF